MTTKETQAIKKLLTTLIKNKTNSLFCQKKLVKKVTELIRKESLILQIKKDLEYQKRLNDLYLLYLDTIKNREDAFKNNIQDAKGMCTGYSNEYNEFLEKINKFEKEISEKKSEKERIISNCQAILQSKMSEKTSLKKSLNELEEKIEKQNKHKDNLLIQIQDLKTCKEKERIEFNKREKLFNDKYDSKLKKYKTLKLYWRDYQTKNNKYLNDQTAEYGNNSISMMMLEKEDKEM